MQLKTIITMSGSVLLASCASVEHHKVDSNEQVSDSVITHQRHMLEKNTKGKGIGPQAPRDIDSYVGNNHIEFNSAPAYTEMNLCNIHFHKNAEHKGGEFKKYAGNGDGHGYQSGYIYTGTLNGAELAHVEKEICPSSHGSVSPGDTIEVHYVYSTAQVKPGPTLGSCLSESIKNPQLRVEAQVYSLVNDKTASDFRTLSQHGMKNGLHQALNIPSNTGEPIQYAGKKHKR